MESIFRSIMEKKIINTGFLKGPICPIYGIGAIIMFTFLQSLENNIVLLFLASIIILTLWEYIVGVMLEKMFHTRYWDYSDHKFNIQGRICLSNSIYWGVLGVVFVKYIHPNIQNLVQKVDIKLLYFIVTILMVVFIVDMITSIVKIKNIKSTLEKIEELNKEIREKIKEIKILPKEIQEKEEEVQRRKQQIKGGISFLQEKFSSGEFKVTDFKGLRKRIDTWLKKADLSSLPQDQYSILIESLNRIYTTLKPKEKKNWTAKDAKIWKDVARWTGEEYANKIFDEIIK